MDVSGVGLVLTPASGSEPLRYAPTLTFKETNNEREYDVVNNKVAPRPRSRHRKPKGEMQFSTCR